MTGPVARDGVARKIRRHTVGFGLAIADQFGRLADLHPAIVARIRAALIVPICPTCLADWLRGCCPEPCRRMK